MAEETTSEKPADVPAAPPAKPAAAKKEATKKVAATKTKPAAKKPAAKNGDEAPYGLVSKIESHGVTYTKITVSRSIGDKLKKGARFDAKVAADGTITLRPAKAASARRR